MDEIALRVAADGSLAEREGVGDLRDVGRAFVFIRGPEGVVDHRFCLDRGRRSFHS